MRIIKTCKFRQEHEHDHESRARFYCLTSTITSLLQPTLTVVFRSRARFFSLGRYSELDYYPSRRCGESGELTLSFILSPLSFWKWVGSRGHFEGGGYFAHKHESRARTRYLSDTNTSFLRHPDHRAPRTVLVISPAIFGVLNCAELCSSFML